MKFHREAKQNMKDFLKYRSMYNYPFPKGASTKSIYGFGVMSIKYLVHLVHPQFGHERIYYYSAHEDFLGCPVGNMGFLTLGPGRSKPGFWGWIKVN